MDKLLLFSAIMVVSVFISSISQVLLKISAEKSYRNKLMEYLNLSVITAYGLFFISTFITMYALKVVPLSMAPILEASGYIFVAILSRLVLKERIGRRKLEGLLVILIGIAVYAGGM